MKLYGEVWPGTVLCFYPGTVVSHSECQFQTFDILIGRGDGAYIGEGREGASIGSGYFFSPNELLESWKYCQSYQKFGGLGPKKALQN